MLILLKKKLLEKLLSTLKHHGLLIPLPPLFAQGPATFPAATSRPISSYHLQTLVIPWPKDANSWPFWAMALQESGLSGTQWNSREDEVVSSKCSILGYWLWFFFLNDFKMEQFLKRFKISTKVSVWMSLCPISDFRSKKLNLRAI